MTFTLTDSQKQLQLDAKTFVNERILPVRTENDRSGKFDLELVKDFAKQGYLGAILPKKYGGMELDHRSYAVLLEEIGLGCSTMRTLLSVQTSLVAKTILQFGTQQQRERYLPKLATGEWLSSFCLTEPLTGSDAANQQTIAQATASGFTLNGAKHWISFGNYAKLALVFAQTDKKLGHKGVTAFLVETDQPGYKSSKIEGKLGLRSCDTASLLLEDVQVPKDAVLGEIGQGFKIAMAALDSGRYSVAAGCVGICRGSLEAAISHAKSRHQFQRPIASFQLVQSLIAEIEVMTEAARLLVWRAGELKDQQLKNTKETSIAKLYATEAAVKSADKAIQVHGGSGYSDQYPVERYLRDARVTTLYEGTSEIQKLIIGRESTGINALIPN